jgi:hypothetical protein
MVRPLKDNASVITVRLQTYHPFGRLPVGNPGYLLEKI